MESNGKSVKLDALRSTADRRDLLGEPAPTGSMPSTNDPPGTKLIPADFIAFAESTTTRGPAGPPDANCLAQSKALAFGKTAEEIAAEGTPASVIPTR